MGYLHRTLGENIQNSGQEFFILSSLSFQKTVESRLTQATWLQYVLSKRSHTMTGQYHERFNTEAPEPVHLGLNPGSATFLAL